MNLYFCPTNIIATFHSLSVSGAAMGGYPNIILIMSLLTFFFSKSIIYISLVSAFIANTLNSIIKFTICFFSLFECFDFPFSICYLALVTKHCLDFFNKIITILDIIFFYLVNFLLCINSYNTSSKLDYDNLVISCCNSVTLEK